MNNPARPSKLPFGLLRAGVERNLHDLFRAMARLKGAEIDETGPVSRHHSHPSNPMFKGAWATRLTEDDADAGIDDTIAWFRSRRAPYFFWWTGPDATPVDLPDRLRAKGLLSMAEQQTELAPASNRPPPEPP